MAILRVKIVHNADWTYSVFNRDTNEEVFSSDHPNEVFAWLSEHGACEIEFENIDMEYDDDCPDCDDDIEMGFNPYCGCYDYDC
jgi:hypothetical protein